jgi:RimJ/RimL family protein N-acetyltransferase
MTVIEPETERLLLRQWRVEDREPFAALNADRRVMEFFPSTLDRAASDALIDDFESFIAEHAWGFWAVELKRTRDFIGSIGLLIPRAKLPFAPCVEVGWRLAPLHWGNGYATEGARSALAVGFDTLELDEILAFTSVLNRRSRAVMERLGMREETDTFEHPSVPLGSRIRTHCAYRLSRAEWVENTG